MPVIGVNIEKVNCERLKSVSGPVEIRSNTNIKDVTELSMPDFNRKGLNIKFEFTTDYLDQKKEKYGFIKIKGNVLYMDPDQQDRIVDEWKKTKKLDKKVNIEILNSILRKCIIKSMSFSDDLQLPPPIALPYAREKQPKRTEETQ